jgi:hypothetical protein
LAHAKVVIDVEGVLFWALHFFVVPGGHHEAALRNYEANDRAKKQTRGATKVKNKILESVLSGA